MELFDEKITREPLPTDSFTFSPSLLFLFLSSSSCSTRSFPRITIGKITAVKIKRC